jgi:hypothetical protein
VARHAAEPFSDFGASQHTRQLERTSRALRQFGSMKNFCRIEHFISLKSIILKYGHRPAPHVACQSLARGASAAQATIESESDDSRNNGNTLTARGKSLRSKTGLISSARRCQISALRQSGPAPAVARSLRFHSTGVVGGKVRSAWRIGVDIEKGDSHG